MIICIRKLYERKFWYGNVGRIERKLAKLKKNNKLVKKLFNITTDYISSRSI